MSTSLLVSAVLALLPSLAAGQATTRVSVSSSGAQGDWWGMFPSISGDGRYVAFSNRSGNLVPGDTNQDLDVFVHDRLTGETSRVSVSSSGLEGNDWSYRPSISADGRYVAFDSLASNLVLGDTNGALDVFVHDRLTATTQRVSISSSGVPGNWTSGGPSISGDGRYVAFVSDASNLVLGDTNGVQDVFVRDRLMGETSRVSVNSSGGQGNYLSASASLSADGRHVAFMSHAGNLVPGITGVWWDIFVHDRLTGETSCVSLGTAGALSNGDSWDPAISGDGRYVAFESHANNLVPGDTNGVGDIFVHDRLNGETRRVSLGSGGEQGNSWSESASISFDGRYVAFTSNASNLVPGDTNGQPDVFVHDRLSGETRRVSISSAGSQGNASSRDRPSICDDGRYVAFTSSASNLVPGDTNGQPDIFVHDLLVIGVAYCFGDGSGSPCPCGNSGAPGKGCANSTTMGAILTADGSPSVNADDLRFRAQNLMAGQAAILFAGRDQLSGGSGVSLGDGLLCAGVGSIRLDVKLVNSSGEAVWGPGLVQQATFASGTTMHFQAWYSDSGMSPCSSGFNFTNGYGITFTN